ncbi:MAG TPA: tetratricopeptide repeat protein [Polyangiaceae bacterium]|jgi:tetratricopeptide (TPR) repeat protein
MVLSWALALSGNTRSASAQESQLDALRAAARSNAADPSAALALGRALRRAGHALDALTELRRGIAVSAPRPDVLVQLHWEVARVQMDRRDQPQTMTACSVLGKLPGASAEGHACVADGHLLWQRSTEALGETAAALAKDPRCYEAKVAEGRADEFALDVGKSEAAYRAAIGWRADGVDAHLGLGRLLARNGRKDDGVAELRSALRLDPYGPDALFELGVALAPSAESMTLLERATRERPSFAEAWLALGSQQLGAGRVADARRSAEAAWHGDPNSVGPHILNGRVALAEGRPDDAIRSGEAALKIMANSAPARLLIADGNARKGEIDLALEAYQAAWGLDHADPTPLVHAAEACHAAGRDTSARAFGLKAAQEFPKWGPAWAALGDALAAQGEKQTARDAYQKALAGDGPIDRAAIQKKLGALQ